MTVLPPWMSPRTTPDDWQRVPYGPEVAATPQKRNLVRRALGSITGLLGALAELDSTAHPGLLHSVDARAKTLGFVGLIVVMTCVHHLPTLALGIGLAVALAFAAHIPLRRLLGAWLLVPFISLLLTLPVMLNIITPGHSLWVLWPAGAHLGPWRSPGILAVTDAGVLVTVRFLLRITACAILILLLTATTRPVRLFRSLRLLGMPQIFVMLLTMMERYLGVIARAGEEIHLAKLSRSIVPGSVRMEQAWVAAGMGSLFRRTHALGEDVYHAMLSRGYTGEVHLLDDPHWQVSDWLFLAAMLILGVLFVLMG